MAGAAELNIPAHCSESFLSKKKIFSSTSCANHICMLQGRNHEPLSNMMVKILFFATILVGTVTSTRWYPSTVHEHLCKCKDPVTEYIPNKDVFTHIGRLDRSTLSRTIAIDVLSHADKYRQPTLTGEWEYMGTKNNWRDRLHIYGMNVVKLDVRGNGNCFFFSLEVAFRKYGYTIEVLHRFLNHRLSDAVKVGILNMKTESPDFYTALELKRLTYIQTWGLDPDVTLSVDAFDPEAFKTILTEYALFRSLHVDNPRDPTYDRWKKYDYQASLKLLESGMNVKTVAMKVFNEAFKAHEEDMAYEVDIGPIETIFSFKALLFDMKNTRLGCNNVDRERFDIEFVVMMYYNNGCHFALMGLIDLHEPTEPHEPTAVVLAKDLPLPIAIMIGDDCVFKTNQQLG